MNVEFNIPKVDRVGGVGGVILAIVAFIGARFILDWPASPDAVPWEVTEAADGRTDLFGEALVYDFPTNFIDTEHLWRVEVKPALMKRLIENLELKELPGPDAVPGDFWRLTPHWWDPPRDRTGRYFRTSEFPTQSRGPDGVFYLMAYDEAHSLLHVWHKNNF